MGEQIIWNVKANCNNMILAVQRKTTLCQEQPVVDMLERLWSSIDHLQISTTEKDNFANDPSDSGMVSFVVHSPANQVVSVPTLKVVEITRTATERTPSAPSQGVSSGWPTGFPKNNRWHNPESQKHETNKEGTNEQPVLQQQVLGNQRNDKLGLFGRRIEAVCCGAR